MQLTKRNVNRQILVIVFALLYAATYVISTWLLKHYTFEKPVLVAIAVVPIITFSIFIFKYIKAFSIMDELKQRIQLEAVVIGFSLLAMLLMLLFLLSLCGISSPPWFGYSHLVVGCWLFYFVGWGISTLKYRA